MPAWARSRSSVDSLDPLDMTKTLDRVSTFVGDRTLRKT